MTAPATWPAVLSALMEGADLPAEATAWAMSEIMSGAATPVQVGAFAVALRAKGETVDEVEGLVRAMYEHATELPVRQPVLDVVGTGGDRAQTVNISTMAAIVVAGTGVRVVKHGNRAASSACGAADLLEQLGIPLDLPPARVAEVAEEAGITFCFAPVFHPALRHAAAARRELGVPTTFNFLGPIANPARPAAQAVGVADARMAGILAGVLAGREVSALVFRGDDGLDELTTTTTSRVWLVSGGEVHEERLDPAAFDIPLASVDALRGGDARHNAEVARHVLAGEDSPVRYAVLLNAAAALVAWYGVTGLPVDPFPGGLVRLMRRGLNSAARSIDTGAAAAVLERWVTACRK